MKNIYKTKLLQVIQKHVPENTRIYLFGSRARGTHNFGSDFDIALDAGVPLGWNVLGAIIEDIENSNIPFFVDVVDMQQVAQDMKHNIEQDGILWKM